MPNRTATLPRPGTDPAADTAFPGVTTVLAVILGLTALRLLLALLDRTELSTDEAQYWLWGQTMEWGYYSKPPLIGWIMRVSTDLFGQSVWAVRLAAGLMHGATALVILAAARRMVPASVAGLAALLYLTLPAVALGSALMTTDTPLLLAAAVALWAHLRLTEARAEGQAAPGFAVALGLALGVGLLAKHAMLFWLGGMAVAMLVAPAWRIRGRDAVVAGLVFLAVIAPHLAWLAETRFVTVAHIQDITEARGISLSRPLRFLAEQALVVGPVVFLALSVALWQARRDRRAAGLLALTLVPLAIVVAQGLRGPVLANWAVLYVVPGSVLAAIWLSRRPKLAALAVALGLVVSVALPMAKVLATGAGRGDGQLLLSRYLGHGETAAWVLDAARDQGARTLVARDRDLLADLSWFTAGQGLAVRAVPPRGQPRHHWEMSAAFDPGRDEGPVLLLVRLDRERPCTGATEIARQTAGPGFAAGDVLALFRLDDPSCLLP